jgi:hypothetical protein
VVYRSFPEEVTDISKSELVEAAVDTNIRFVGQSLIKPSPVIRRLVDSGKYCVAPRSNQ